MFDLFVPRTDAGAIGQAVVLLPVLAVVTWRMRHDRNLWTFWLGVLVFTAAWMALRTLH